MKQESSITRCERCGARSAILLDYCALCSKNLCPTCMAEGCCGGWPAMSGMEQDYGDDQEDDLQEGGGR